MGTPYAGAHRHDLFCFGERTQEEILMADLTQAEFATAVRAAVSGVQHLYREVDRLNAALREALQSDPEPFVRFGGAPVKQARSDGSRTIRNEYAQLFRPATEI